jgi:hypothetical protein
MKRANKKQTMKRTKPARIVNKKILKKLKKEAVKYMPHIHPVVHTLSIRTLLYHLPDDKVKAFKSSIYEN